MVKQSPERFEPGALADEGARYRALLPQRRFKRLAELLLEPAGEVEASFSFSRRENDIFVRGRLNSVYRLQCQRCLTPMDYPVDTEFELVFAANEAMAEAIPEEFDPVILDETGHIHIVDMLEDELILQLPAVARHADLADCVSEATEVFDALSQEAEGAAAAEQRPNPFDVLKDLKLH